MKALILAGGEGSRLRPYTTILPKPLMPVGEFSILEIILRQLKTAGVSDIFIAVNRAHQIIQAFFQDGERLGLNISYLVEDSPLGTAGPIATALDSLDDDFLVMNGDILTTLNYKKMYEFHKSKNAAATIALSQRDVSIDYGVITTDENSMLDEYIEKPTYHFQVSAGIYTFNASAIKPHIVSGKFMNIPDLMIRLKNEGKAICCYTEECLWLDIGRPDDCSAATDIFNSQRRKILPQDQ